MYFTPGSSSTKYFFQTRKGVRRVRLSKTRLFQSLALQQFTDLYNRSMNITEDTVNVMIKSELGKHRPFASTSIESFIVMRQFTMYYKSRMDTEDLTLPFFTNFNNSQRFKIFNKLNKLMDGSRRFYAVDQSRFDQHQSLEVLVLGLKNITNYLLQSESDYQLKAHIENLLERMVMILTNRKARIENLNGTFTYKKIEGGLMSGDAITSEIGSVLCFLEASYVIDKLGLRSSLEYIACNGDDLIFIINNPTDFLEPIINVYSEIGGVIHKEKNFSSLNAYSFLKIFYYDDAAISVPFRAVTSLFLFKMTSIPDDIGPATFYNDIVQVRDRFSITTMDINKYHDWIYSLMSHSKLKSLRLYGED